MTDPVFSNGSKPEISDDETTWAGIAHLSATLGLIWWIPGISFLVPFGHIVAPLVVLLTKGRGSRFVYAAAVEALTFQIWMTVYGAALTFVSLYLFGFNLVMIAVFTSAGYAVNACIQVSKGKPYYYPPVLFRPYRPLV